MTDTWVDGNELAGPLREVFALDMTVARGQCAGCGRLQVMAEVRVYARAPGFVARCPGCESVLLKVVRGPDRVWLDLTGLRVLELAVPAADG
jgi:hypothetical protein